MRIGGGENRISAPRAGAPPATRLGKVSKSAKRLTLVKLTGMRFAQRLHRNIWSVSLIHPTLTKEVAVPHTRICRQAAISLLAFGSLALPVLARADDPSERVERSAQVFRELANAPNGLPT